MSRLRERAADLQLVLDLGLDVIDVDLRRAAEECRDLLHAFQVLCHVPAELVEPLRAVPGTGSSAGGSTCRKASLMSIIHGCAHCCASSGTIRASCRGEGVLLCHLHAPLVLARHQAGPPVPASLLVVFPGLDEDGAELLGLLLGTGRSARPSPELGSVVQPSPPASASTRDRARPTLRPQSPQFVWHRPRRHHHCCCSGRWLPCRLGPSPPQRSWLLLLCVWSLPSTRVPTGSLAKPVLMRCWALPRGPLDLLSLTVFLR